MSEPDYEKMYTALRKKYQQLLKVGGDMRREQKKYFANRNSSHLETVCKPLERNFDQLLLEEKYGTQGSLLPADDVDQEGGEHATS